VRKRQQILLIAITIFAGLITIPFCIVFFSNMKTYGLGWIERETWGLQQGETLALWTKVSPFTLDSFDPPMSIRFDLLDKNGSVISTVTRRIEEESDLSPFEEIEQKNSPEGVIVSRFDKRHLEGNILLKRTTP
jgi:hypothetical protein